MRVSVFGIGYVGCVTAACLAKTGHEVIGVDVNPDKVSLLNEAMPPVVEAGLGGLLYPSSIAGVGFFADYGHGDFRLAGASPLRGKGTQGTDPGADLALVPPPSRSPGSSDRRGPAVPG